MALIALVPKYAGDAFDDAPPGHRYRLYLQFWNGNDYSPTKIDKLKALHPVCELPEHSKQVMKALACRSQTADTDTTLCIEAKSTAPFATGLGWEHPNENGFAFLDPYGLPYLPGSGVKGVLRQAAWQLVSGDYGENHGWSEETITAVFGEENPNNASCQGAFRFWDVIPELAGDKLAVDILNPHYHDYYQSGGTPHDACQPVPVFFLTLPPNSKFLFRVDLIASLRLDEALHREWKNLLNVAFEHAFEWLGFGAKTAVGYGAMKAEKIAKPAAMEAKAKRTAMSDEQKRIHALQDQLTTANRDQGKGSALFGTLRELIAEASSWKPEDKALLREAAEKAYVHLGVKKDDYKKLLRSLQA